MAFRQYVIMYADIDPPDHYQPALSMYYVEYWYNVLDGRLYMRSSVGWYRVEKSTDWYDNQVITTIALEGNARREIMGLSYVPVKYIRTNEMSVKYD
jgi:hypothetical protein